MRHERHGTGTNIENYISVGLLNVEDVKKRQFFFASCYFIKVQQKVAMVSRKFSSSNKKPTNFSKNNR